MKLPALRAVVPAENGGVTSPLYPAFSFVLRRASKPALFRSQGSGRAGTIPALKAGTQAAHGPQPPQRPRCCSLHQSLTQPLTGGNDWHSSRVPGGSILTLCVLFQEPSLFFTAAQFLMVPPLKNLTKPASLSCPESPDLAFKPISPVLPTQAKISRYFAFLVSVHFRYNI